MPDVDLRGTALRYGAIGGGVTALLLVALAAFFEFPLLLLGMLMVGIPIFIVPGIVGITDEGIETAAASARIGSSTGQPEQYNPGNLIPIPNPLAVVCWLSGVGVAGIVVIVAVT
jgi:hypothetical protein